jgi:hypothetical protein
MLTSMQDAFHMLCSTCSVSSRMRLPAVVPMVSASRSPLALTQMPSLPGFQPESASSALACLGS